MSFFCQTNTVLACLLRKAPHNFNMGDDAGIIVMSLH
jgi:hypothetical protein